VTGEIIGFIISMALLLGLYILCEGLTTPRNPICTRCGREIEHSPHLNLTTYSCIHLEPVKHRLCLSCQADLHGFLARKGAA